MKINCAIKIIAKFLFLSCLLYVASACSFHEQYPPSWSPLALASKNCTDINGAYHDKDDKGSSLSNLLIKKWFGVGKLGEATHVDITRNNLDELIVSAWNGNKIIATKAYPKEEYVCDTNGIALTWTESVLDFFAGVIWYKITLAKAGDNSLVVISESKGAGMLLVIIPFAGNHLEYRKYPAMKGETQMQKENDEALSKK
ncbi:MAG: hypothetical protein K4571_17015 [Deltaproteobacteria bacterium]